MQNPKLPKLNYDMLAVLGLVILGKAFDNSTDFDVGSKLAVVPVAAGLAAAAAPAIIKGVASIGSTLLGGIFGRKKQKDANEAQIKLANEMFEKESQQQWDMWNAQNNYNDPSAQVNRLRSAGINPALALQSVNTGNAQSMTAPKHNMPNIQPETAMADAMGQIPSILGQSFGQYMEYENMLKNFESQDAQNKLIKAQAAGVNIENQYKEQQILAGLQKVWADTGLSKMQRRLAKQEYDWLNSTKQLRYTMLENENNASAESVNKLRQEITSMQIADRIAQEAHFKNLELTEAQIGAVRNAAWKTAREAMELKQRYDDWEDYGRRDDKRKNIQEYENRYQEWRRLVATFGDYVEELHNKKLISDEAYKQAKDRTSEISTENWWYQTLHGQNADSGFESFLSKIVGGLVMASDVFGNVFGSALSKVPAK